jgi:hypothetical protein
LLAEKIATSSWLARPSRYRISRCANALDDFCDRLVPLDLRLSAARSTVCSCGIQQNVTGILLGKPGLAEQHGSRTRDGHVQGRAGGYVNHVQSYVTGTLTYVIPTPLSGNPLFPWR